DADGGLARAAVADDQLALPPSDRDHRVDGLEARLQRLLHRASIDHARRVALDRPELLGLDWALAVDGLAERVEDTPDERLADRHLGDAAGALDRVALLDLLVLPEEHRADLVLLEVEHHPDDVVGELQQFAGHRLLEPVHPRDAIADLDDATDLLQVHLGLVARELALDDLADLSGLDHASPLPLCEALAQSAQLTVHPAVHGEAAELGDEAAEEILVEDFLDDDLLATEGAAQARAQGAPVALRQRHGRPHACAHPALLGVEQAPIRQGDGAEMIGPSLGGDERE